MNQSEASLIFKEELQKTGRRGVDQVIAGLEELGFFTAPASTRFHGNYPGGLVAHSVQVLIEATALRAAQVSLKGNLADSLPEDSVRIVALLHDVCKAEVYHACERFRKDAEGKWEKYNSYTVDYSRLPLGHGEKSVVRLLKWGLELTDEEMVAIRWHMSGFDLSDAPEARGNYGAALEKTPLLALLIAADLLASHILESNG